MIVNNNDVWDRTVLNHELVMHVPPSPTTAADRTHCLLQEAVRQRLVFWFYAREYDKLVRFENGDTITITVNISDEYDHHGEKTTRTLDS